MQRFHRQRKGARTGEPCTPSPIRAATLCRRGHRAPGRLPCPLHPATGEQVQTPTPAALPYLPSLPRQQGSVPGRSWRVLVVDSDKASAHDLSRQLQRHRHDARAVSSGTAALREHADADVVLLNLDLPDVDGLEVCRSIAISRNTPTLAITANGSELDCVLALQAGADDYLVQPYGFRELLARVDAVMRRARPASAFPARADLGPLVIDQATRTVLLHGHPLPLTRKEFDLLQLLASPPGEVVTRRRILQQIWHDTDISRSRTIDTHVNSLRRKLGSSDWIVAVRGIGFRLGEGASAA
ncbi:response regulator transcription factor [Streptomyces sp. ET3-23]|uniref:response regulator transcription factor n=1 Tax=Streptomyces sp. ET3-23 TaxID=2885643 RepID=UPI001D10764A|nr:response regulator transcription factor [Streptomyces sp. ET3-23]MCC2280440.1 response regulator transcription factor [Streptomyces sp. ET3-23]